MAKWKIHEKARIIDEWKHKEVEELEQLHQDTTTEKESRISSLADHLMSRLDSLGQDVTHDDIDQVIQPLVVSQLSNINSLYLLTG